jgi:hypothetical protein
MSKTYRRTSEPTPWWIIKETDEEFISRYWGSKRKIIARYHSDAWSTYPKSWAKRTWSKWRRQHDRQQMHRTISEEYEPQWFQTKIDTWWWD